MCKETEVNELKELSQIIQLAGKGVSIWTFCLPCYLPLLRPDIPFLRKEHLNERSSPESFSVLKDFWTWVCSSLVGDTWGSEPMTATTPMAWLTHLQKKQSDADWQLKAQKRERLRIPLALSFTPSSSFWEWQLSKELVPSLLLSVS